MEWLQVVKELGVTAAMLFAICWAIRAVTMWVASQLIIPARDRFLSRLDRFFDRTEVTMDVLTENVRSVSSHMEQQTGILRRIELQGCGQNPQARELDTRIRPNGPGPLGTIPSQ